VEGAALLDLVCGPVGPLQETHQRYRLVSHLASGGQAEVYRAVRVSGGISSAPVTVKVFRPGDDRPVPDQLRSWDKGDAVLMDLNSRGVTGICRRADGFYAPQPAPPGQPPTGDPVPYQVLDYLHGVTLREYVTGRYGLAGQGPRLDAVAALTTLAGVLRALHLPEDPRACPALHMDVKPANLMLLTGGEVRLIDFTGARYHWRDHITGVAYTRESAGPEAFSGEVGPAYDVHGFGAVAYFLVTGEFPRAEASPPDGLAAPPWSVLRRHPLLDAHPALRDHLLAPVADRPADRPSTAELPDWLRHLAGLVAAAQCPDVGVDWGSPPSAAPTAVAPVAGTETGAFQRIEKLERELVELRTAFGAGAPPATGPVWAAGLAGANGAGASGTGGAVPGGALSGGAVPGGGTPGGAVAAGGSEAAGAAVGRNGRQLGPQPTKVAASPGGQPSRQPDPTRVAPGPPLGLPGPQPGTDGSVWGRASVPQREPDPTLSGEPVAPTPRRPEPARPRPDLATVLNRGSELTGVGVMFAFVCWGIWSVASGRGGLVDKFLIFVFVLLIGVGVFVLARLVGRLVWERLLHRVRRTARGAHAATAAYLVAAGLGFLSATGWVVNLWGWLRTLV
jgi:serine/threonine protein kinase